MVRAAITTREGRRIHVDPDDPRAHALLRTGSSLTPAALALWRRVLLAHDWDLVVDVGPGYGETLVRADLPPGAEVVAVEPDLAVHPHLRRTLAGNDLGRVDLRAAALGQAPPPGRDLGEPGWRVPVESLDEVVGPRARSFCVRVGPVAATAAVLRGAGAVLALRGPWVVVVDAAPALVGAVRHDLLGLDPVEHAFVPVTSAGAAPPGPWVLAAPSIVDALLDGLV